MRIFWTVPLAVLFALQGCLGDGPGQQCLDSFKADLKDPESGKVISFEALELVYTATNSYGARIKGKALCKEVGGIWQRDHATETLKILEKSTATLNASNACLRTKKSSAECAGESLALKRVSATASVDLDALNNESKDALGF